LAITMTFIDYLTRKMPKLVESKAILCKLNWKTLVDAGFRTAAYKIHRNGTKAKFLKWIEGVLNGEEDPSQSDSHPMKNAHVVIQNDEQDHEQQEDPDVINLTLAEEDVPFVRTVKSYLTLQQQKLKDRTAINYKMTWNG